MNMKLPISKEMVVMINYVKQLIEYTGIAIMWIFSLSLIVLAIFGGKISIESNGLLHVITKLFRGG